MNKSQSSNQGLEGRRKKQITTTDSCMLFLIQRLVDCLRPLEHVVLLTLPCVWGGDGIGEIYMYDMHYLMLLLLP